jgi:hypothetical protein
MQTPAAASNRGDAAGTHMTAKRAYVLAADEMNMLFEFLNHGDSLPDGLRL